MLITLNDAVVNEINELVKNNQGFSAHDITKKIREKVNSSALEIDGIPFVTLGGKTTQFIRHNDVRSAVRAYVSCNITNYNCDLRVNSDGIEYSWWYPATNIPVDTNDEEELVTDYDVKADIKTDTTNTVSVKGTDSSKYPLADLSDPKITGKIFKYWEKNSEKSGCGATLKQTQSIMKRNRVTINSLYDLAEKNGFILNNDVRYRNGEPIKSYTSVQVQP